ncbi:PREDICTED: LOC110747193 partial [Prunus dulcis]|uniref:PREDICTED: LOC110747193 partial n=1 Tax=Prunus dulcis TaxID=3755 RepID=A0A5E4G2W7_PRUDU|nr:PREDICTED: LOC110747193 partial [Prunus dulcis]
MGHGEHKLCERVWDEYGLLVSAGGIGDLKCCLVLMVETEAVHMTFMACIEKQYSRVVLESDSTMIIGIVRGEETVDMKVESIIFDIRQLTRRLEQVCFSFTKRWGNHADHEVAAFVTRKWGYS